MNQKNRYAAIVDLAKSGNPFAIIEHAAMRRSHAEGIETGTWLHARRHREC